MRSHLILLAKGLFTSWTMKLSHVIRHFFMVTLHDHTFIVWFLTKCLLKVFGPLTRCKLKVNQEKRPCTKKWMSWFFLIYVYKAQFWDISSFLTFSPSSPFFLCNHTNIWHIYTYIYDPLLFAMRGPLLHLPPQNPLDHDSG